MEIVKRMGERREGQSLCGGCRQAYNSGGVDGPRFTGGGTANDHLSHRAFPARSLADHRKKTIGAFSMSGKQIS